MKLLIDTDVLCVLLARPDRLSKESLDAVRAASDAREICVSVASLLQLRESHKRGEITDDHLKAIDKWMLEHHAQVLAIDVKVVASMSRIHQNESMADRLILATARTQECQLATFRQFEDPEVEFIVCTSGNASAMRQKEG